MNDSTKPSVLFPELISKPAIVDFDEPKVTSDGGSLLLQAFDDQAGLTPLNSPIAKHDHGHERVSAVVAVSPPRRHSRPCIDSLYQSVRQLQLDVRHDTIEVPSERPAQLLEWPQT